MVLLYIFLQVQNISPRPATQGEQTNTKPQLPSTPYPHVTSSFPMRFHKYLPANSTKPNSFLATPRGRPYAPTDLTGGWWEVRGAAQPSSSMCSTDGVGGSGRNEKYVDYGTQNEETSGKVSKSTVASENTEGRVNNNNKKHSNVGILYEQNPMATSDLLFSPPIKNRPYTSTGRDLKMINLHNTPAIEGGRIVLDSVIYVKEGGGGFRDKINIRGGDGGLVEGSGRRIKFTMKGSTPDGSKTSRRDSESQSATEAKGVLMKAGGFVGGIGEGKKGEETKPPPSRFSVMAIAGGRFNHWYDVVVVCFYQLHEYFVHLYISFCLVFCSHKPINIIFRR